MNDAEGFSEAQKQYLDGFLSGLLAKHGGGTASPAPDDIHREAQDRFIAAGKTLTPEEHAKRQGNPLDMWDEIRANAAAAKFPKGIDVFRHKFHGLFYTAPAQDSFMCRLRMPNGILSAYQFRGIADLAERFGDGHADITTRANLQLRGIAAANSLAILTGVQELGLVSRGAGADNIRNITGSPTAGIDRQELIDTRPLAHELHHTILNHRELYGLPRKFNIAFDGGGAIAVLADTNDIGFSAVRVGESIYFRLALAGITGHGDHARDSGVLVAPDECVAVAVAIVRVFIAHGDRTDRKRARLKYLLDQWGIERFLAEVEALLPFKLQRVPETEIAKRAPPMKQAHLGVHPQRQPARNYVGIVIPVGHLSARQVHALSDVADRFGNGTLRLTVWQNLLISDVPDAMVKDAVAALAAQGFAVAASNIRGALVACTGNTGCKFALSDTKRDGLGLADHLDRVLTLDGPISIHVTGCPHSCAQHLIGDIGLLGVKIPQGEDLIDGYSIAVGGGAGAERAIGREIYPQVPLAAVPAQVEGILRAYLAHRTGPDESFHDFVARHPISELQAMVEAMP